MTVYDAPIIYDDTVLNYDGAMFMFGIDQSSRPPPSASALVAAGVKFCSHYIADRWTSPVTLTDPSTWPTKCLRPKEVQAYIDAGIQMFTNWETSATAMTSGYSRGVEAARNSLTMAKLCGLPDDRPIYFSADSVDFNTFDTYKLARSFLQGAVSVLGVDRVGVYGSYYVVDWAVGDGVAKWFWQTYAWSDKQWHSATHIQQFPDGASGKFHVTIDGIQCDIDRSVKADYGQWPVGGDMPLDTTDLDNVKAQVKAGVSELFRISGAMDIIQFGQSNNVRAFSILASRLQSIEAKINGLTSTLSDDESKILAALTASTTDPAILAQAVVTALENQGVPIDVTIDHEQLKTDFLAVLQGLVFKAQ